MRTMLMSFCFSLAIAVGASPSFAATKTHHHPAARAQAPVVQSYRAPIPAPIDPLYAACRDMTIAFPACPGH
jgi:hypothetical protein